MSRILEQDYPDNFYYIDGDNEITSEKPKILNYSNFFDGTPVEIYEQYVEQQ